MERRYKIEISHSDGYIVWIYDPFSCGEWIDLIFFENILKKYNLPGEKVVVDNGYAHNNCITLSTTIEQKKNLYYRVYARNKSCNTRLKFFKILKYAFVVIILPDTVVFHAAARLLALSLKFDNLVF